MVHFTGCAVQLWRRRLKQARTSWYPLRSVSDLQGHRLSGDRIEYWYDRRLDRPVTKNSRDLRKFRAGQTEDSFNSIQQQGFLKGFFTESQKLYKRCGQSSVWYKQEAERLGENLLSYSAGIKKAQCLLQHRKDRSRNGAEWFWLEAVVTTYLSCWWWFLVSWLMWVMSSWSRQENRMMFLIGTSAEKVHLDQEAFRMLYEKLSSLLSSAGVPCFIELHFIALYKYWIKNFFWSTVD